MDQDTTCDEAINPREAKAGIAATIRTVRASRRQMVRRYGTDHLLTHQCDDTLTLLRAMLDGIKRQDAFSLRAGLAFFDAQRIGSYPPDSGDTSADRPRVAHNPDSDSGDA